MLFSLNDVKLVGKFVMCLQPVNRSEIPRCFLIKCWFSTYVDNHNINLVSFEIFVLSVPKT